MVAVPLPCNGHYGSFARRTEEGKGSREARGFRSEKFRGEEEEGKRYRRPCL